MTCDLRVCGSEVAFSGRPRPRYIVIPYGWKVAGPFSWLEARVFGPAIALQECLQKAGLRILERGMRRAQFQDFLAQLSKQVRPFHRLLDY